MTDNQRCRDCNCGLRYDEPNVAYEFMDTGLCDDCALVRFNDMRDALQQIAELPRLGFDMGYGKDYEREHGDYLRYDDVKAIVDSVLGGKS